jgi:hypothetical protein
MRVKEKQRRQKEMQGVSPRSNFAYYRNVISSVDNTTRQVTAQTTPEVRGGRMNQKLRAA